MDNFHRIRESSSYTNLNEKTANSKSNSFTDLPNYCTVSRKIRNIIKSQDLEKYTKLNESVDGTTSSSSNDETLVSSGEEVINVIEPEALTILNELDAILDNHENEADDYVKVEDCLVELDTYLDEIDDKFSSDEENSERGKTNRKSLNRSKSLPKKAQNGRNSTFIRGLNIRNTIGNGALQYQSNEKENNDINGKLSESKKWRRNSMRKTSPVIIPANCREVRMPEEQISRDDDLSQIQILSDIIQVQNQETNNHRPRQLGRRAESAHTPRILSIVADSCENNGNRRLVITHDTRPMSAPATTEHSSSRCQEESRSRYISSEPSSVGSSRNPSPVSLMSLSSASSSIDDPTITTRGPSTITTNENIPQPPVHSRTTLDPDNIFIPPHEGINSKWPHCFSRGLGLLTCTLGLFNISRFAILTINYGGNFLLQFLILSIIFGIPFFWLQMCLGNKIKAGPVSMWKISPICKGIGISLVLMQAIMALYSTVSLSWCLVYLRDSFLSKTHTQYNWQEPFYLYRRSTNNSYNLTETIADYFNGLVLQRWQLGVEYSPRRIETGGLAFNLAIIWTCVFLVLCKGLKSLGKIVIGLTIIPLIMFTVITGKLLYIIDYTTIQNIFSAADFDNFLLNSKTWTAAAQETFLTWGLLGSSVISMTSRNNSKEESPYTLRREACLVVFLTIFGLGLSAVFGFCCIQILENNDYIYFPGSYENVESYVSVYSRNSNINPTLISLPIKFIPHYSSLLGETYYRPQNVPNQESGYQSLRLITELFPATVSIGSEEFTSPWTISTFFMFIFFGIGQLCAMWKPISTALGESTSSVLLSCVTGLLLGIPLATEIGISIIHFFDLVIGGAWWILVIITALIFGVFLIRGRPYNGDVLVNDLKMGSSFSAYLALSWNVLLPIGLICLAVIEYKISRTNQFFHWRGKAYFSYWARKVGGLTQVGFLLLVPLVSIVQIYRYLSKGPPDILERIQLLYRPSMTSESRRNTYSANQRSAINDMSQSTTIDNMESHVVRDDAPPKYTPPPSYTTATGACLAKILRQSVRRSVRRYCILVIITSVSSI
ncbi:hypothetical protein ACFFRR_000781 [Megaselia abdita]